MNILGSLRSSRVLLLGVLCLFFVFRNCFLFTKPRKIDCMPQSQGHAELDAACFLFPESLLSGV